ncbi:pilus assembly protein [Lysobacter soyae]|uniref:PilY1 beta-propeller domain-containing protein n=1 Tax=Lysobacter soyae TaxID=2764185 RepID=A0ABX8WNS0_9GAMM|nr:PilC/PilY family type IV pilus protein [Lysobacter sp. CJ11]QYR52533.1 hypothetical protein H8L67_08025 [Lysobacter sp. CJ11]
MKNSNSKMFPKQRMLTAIAALACTLAGVQVNAATFPNSPLITGGEGIPPNILLILDDSGSMAFTKMPDDANNLADTVSDRSYVTNSIYYNPTKTYSPWRTSSTVLTDRLAQADFWQVASSTTSPTASRIDLRDSAESYFYVPKIANPGTVEANYDKYRISTSSSSTSYSGGVVQKRGASSSLASATIARINSNSSSSCISVPLSGKSEITITVTGSTRADIYAYRSNNCSNNGYGSNTSNSNPKSLTFTADSSATTIYFLIYADTNNNISNVSYNVTGVAWADMTPSGNTSALQQAELKNYANWYQYFRTRSKTAKAGASEAFGRLGSRYRVGFDTIWNRGGSTTNTAGSSPAFPIPFTVADGAFSGANRDTFYARLHGATASSGTPLQGALQRSARYFSTDDPWKDSSNRMLSCRQNYSILTTDGFWNDQSGYTAVGNADSGSTYSDAYADTLADVAYKYWANDLKTGASWPNNVRPSTSDPATWQHMVTFGVSIGLQGRLNPNNPPPSTWADPTDTEDEDRIDDLWHASLNGHGKFVVAGDADQFADALKAALDTISERTASGSNIASSSTKTDAGTLTFSAKFTSGSWIGDMSASPFNAALTGVSTTPLWTLSNTFGTTGVNANFANRFVFTTWNGLPVRFDASYPGVAQFERTGGLDAVAGDDNIRYINGDQSKEIGRTNGTLRQRAYPIGDIVDSSPSYSADSGTVFVGANDGFLHGINATNGKVLFSYIPKGVLITDLKTLSSTDYQHRYFMDGQIDVVSRANQGYGKNILVGAPGRGAKGVFALDVTNPATMSIANFLWDNTYGVDNDMGYVLGNVRLRKSNKLDALGKPTVFAFVPNGIDSTSGKAVLFVYELTSTGAIANTYKLTTDNATNNGMMSTGLADLDANGTMDTVYGGDLLGRVWKWDISVINAARPLPAVFAGTKIFQTTDGTNPQPITGGISVARDTNGQIFVGFGTGRLISLSDVPGNAGYVSQTQSMYGVKDLGTLVAKVDLLQRTIPFTGTLNGLPVRGFESYQDLPAGKKGWYINLGVPAATADGERVITSPTIVGSAMWLTSVIPAQGSDCSGALGSGYLNVVNVFTGTSPLQNSYFDTNATIPGANNTNGLVGSMGIIGGMPTEVNVTSQLATVGDGGGGSPVSFRRTLPLGGIPQRMTWREIVAPDN